MGKPIAGRGDLPYNIGGFCVSAAKYKGQTYTNLNIIKQRSYTVFDLVKTDGTVLEFVQLTYRDTKHVPLDSTKDASVLVNEINDDTFFIKATNNVSGSTAFITSFQYNKIKLSNGESLYRPWDLFFCNVTPETPSIDIIPSTASIVIHEDFTPTVIIKPDTFSKSLIWTSSDSSIATVSNGVVTGVGEGDVTITATSSTDSTVNNIAKVRVDYVPMQGVKFKNGSRTIHVNAGGTINYELEFVPSNASNRNINLEYNNQYFTAVLNGTTLSVSAPISSSGISMDKGLVLSVGSKERSDVFKLECSILIYEMDGE